MFSEELTTKITKYATEHNLEPGAFVEQAVESYQHMLCTERDWESRHGKTTILSCGSLAKKMAESYQDIKEIDLWYNEDDNIMLCCYVDFDNYDSASDLDFDKLRDLARQKVALLHQQFGQETVNNLPVKLSVDAGYSQVFVDGYTWALGNALTPDGDPLFVRGGNGKNCYSCPQCGSALFAEWRNVERSRWGACESCGIAWAQETAGSSWLEESDEVWDENVKYLNQFKKVHAYDGTPVEGEELAYW